MPQDAVFCQIVQWCVRVRLWLVCPLILVAKRVFWLSEINTLLTLQSPMYKDKDADVDFLPEQLPKYSFKYLLTNSQKDFYLGLGF